MLQAGMIIRTPHMPISARMRTLGRPGLKFALPAFVLLWAAIPLPAEIPKPTDAPGPMSPEQSAAAFRLPDGFRLEVVASEPLIATASAGCWDERGRMFVSELHGYNLE